MYKDLDVIGIGTPFVDYFFEGNESFLKKHRLKPEDDLLFNQTDLTLEQIFKNLPLLDKSPGGIPANTIAILPKLGVRTGFYCVIGKDEDGDYWLENIGNIDKSKIIRAGKMNVCACILTHQRKYRTFFSEVNSKDNYFFQNPDFKYLNSAKFIHIGPHLSGAEKNINQVSNLIKKITKPKISFSPSIYYINHGIDKILPILQKTYILFLNKKELKLLTKKRPEEGSKFLLKIGVKIVVSTLGDKGVLITSKDEQFFSPATRVKEIIDTTGAGDTFAAGFIYGLLKKYSLKRSANFANKLASRSLSDFGLRWLINFNFTKAG